MYEDGGVGFTECQVSAEAWVRLEDPEMGPYRKLAQAVVLRAVADAYPQQSMVPGCTSVGGQRDLARKARRYIFTKCAEVGEDHPLTFDWWCEMAGFSPAYLRRNLRIVAEALYVTQRSAAATKELLAEVERNRNVISAFKNWGHAPRLRVMPNRRKRR